jgi:phage shock protein PspC (stress-responsive transcriptional regulator)/FtsH-binding integral membrane protein
MRGTARAAHGEAMTTTDFTGALPPSPAPPPPPPTEPPRVLRRSRTDRVAAGVSGGLGRYFGVDPVLFRVLFATSAFFGGAGLLAYLLAWVAIPDEGMQHAAVDRWIHGLRQRRVPVWAVVIVAAVVLWIAAFSWWAPGPFFPVMIAVIVLVALFGRRGRSIDAPPALGASALGAPGPAVAELGTSAVVPGSTTEPNAAAQTGAGEPFAAPSGQAGPGFPPGAPETPPVWVAESRSWLQESRAAARERRRRAMPVRLATIITLVTALTVLGITDAVSGIRIPVYFWVTLVIALGGLLVGAVMRRTPWSVALLLVPAAAGLVAFSPTHASLHDGSGQREWAPTTSLSHSYKLAFGEGVLDLRGLSASAVRDVHVDIAAGHLRILIPKEMAATVEANIHFGQIVVDGTTVDETRGGRDSGGYNLNRRIEPAPVASGAPFTIDAHLADGEIEVQHV